MAIGGPMREPCKGDLSEGQRSELVHLSPCRQCAICACGSVCGQCVRTWILRPSVPAGSRGETEHIRTRGPGRRGVLNIPVGDAAQGTCHRTIQMVSHCKLRADLHLLHTVSSPTACALACAIIDPSAECFHPIPCAPRQSCCSPLHKWQLLCMGWQR